MNLLLAPHAGVVFRVDVDVGLFFAPLLVVRGGARRSAIKTYFRTGLSRMCSPIRGDLSHCLLLVTHVSGEAEPAASPAPRCTCQRGSVGLHDYCHGPRLKLRHGISSVTHGAASAAGGANLTYQSVHCMSHVRDPCCYMVITSCCPRLRPRTILTSDRIFF